MRLLKAYLLGFLALAGAAFTANAAPFFQDFEANDFGWYGATRVSSGSNGVVDKPGSAYHAEDVAGNAYTEWGGYSSTFPEGGYHTSVDIYLDVNGGFANNTRFDFSSAITTPGGIHRRDFIFNAGYYNDTDAPGSGARFVISASNNSQPGSAYAKNPDKSPVVITEPGWYTFDHKFYADNAGVLHVEMTIRDAYGALKGSWTLSDSADVIGTTVGGNRYGWFDFNQFPVLAFDNALRSDLSLRAQKLAVDSDLVALYVTVTNDDDAKKLKDAINHLNKSLDSNNWLDDLHPKPGSKGETVFNEEKPTVTRLRELRDKNHGDVLNASLLQGFIDRLVNIDRDLALTAINDANARNGKSDKIKAANNELGKGDDEADKDHPDKAIDHYKNSWKNAIDA